MQEFLVAGIKAHPVWIITSFVTVCSVICVPLLVLVWREVQTWPKQKPTRDKYYRPSGTES